MSLREGYRRIEEEDLKVGSIIVGPSGLRHSVIEVAGFRILTRGLNQGTLGCHDITYVKSMWLIEQPQEETLEELSKDFDELLGPLEKGVTDELLVPPPSNPKVLNLRQQLEEYNEKYYVK